MSSMLVLIAPNILQTQKTEPCVLLLLPSLWLPMPHTGKMKRDQGQKLGENGQFTTERETLQSKPEMRNFYFWWPHLCCTHSPLQTIPSIWKQGPWLCTSWFPKWEGTLPPTGPACPTGSKKMDWAGMVKVPHLATQVGGHSLQHRTEEDSEAKPGLSRKRGDLISNGSKEDSGPCARDLLSRSRELCKWRNQFS